MTIDANGNVVINEYKSSLTAPLTSNQKIVFPEIFESGATIVGKGKGIFSGGYQSGGDAWLENVVFTATADSALSVCGTLCKSFHY